MINSDSLLWQNLCCLWHMQCIYAESEITSLVPQALSRFPSFAVRTSATTESWVGPESKTFFAFHKVTRNLTHKRRRVATIAIRFSAKNCWTYEMGPKNALRSNLLVSNLPFFSAVHAPRPPFVYNAKALLADLLMSIIAWCKMSTS